MTKMRSIRLDESSSIIVSFGRVDREPNTSLHACSPEILIVSFRGKYRDGSAGNADADYMRSMAEAGIYSTNPIALILDFSDLAYEWGDKIDWVLDAGTDKYRNSFFPMAVVFDDGCANGLQSLIRGIDSTEPLDDNETFFWDLDDAIDHVFHQIDENRK